MLSPDMWSPPENDLEFSSSQRMDQSASQHPKTVTTSPFHVSEGVIHMNNPSQKNNSAHNDIAMSIFSDNDANQANFNILDQIKE